MNKIKNCFKVFLSCYLILLQISEISSRGQARIVGGGTININYAPFLVQFIDHGTCICGGTLISDYYVITAAHCVENRSIEYLSVAAGTSKQSDKGVRSKVSKIKVPDSYNSKSADTDVAVIKLMTPLKGPAIRPARPCKTSWREGHPVIIYGWGLNVDKDDKYPDQLHTVKVNVYNKERCQKLYPLRTLTDSMFCASGENKDACLGDSGGPAIINGQFCGIISWGNGCGHADAPGVYTDVRTVKQFIDKAMKE